MIFPRAYLCRISRSWKYDSNSVLRPILSLRVLTLALMFTLMHSHTAHLSDKLQIFLKLQNFLKNFRPKRLEKFRNFKLWSKTHLKKFQNVRIFVRLQKLPKIFSFLPKTTRKIFKNFQKIKFSFRIESPEPQNYSDEPEYDEEEEWIF